MPATGIDCVGRRVSHGHVVLCLTSGSSGRPLPPEVQAQLDALGKAAIAKG